MVPAPLIEKLKAAYATLCQTTLDVHNYEGQMFDVTFEIVTLETGIAGLVDTFLTSWKMPSEHIDIVRKSLLTNDGRLILRNSTTVDLSDYPDLLRHVKLLDHVRDLLLQSVRAKQK